MTTPAPLSPTLPADATFRTLGRLCRERALSDEPAEGAPDLRPIWRFLGMTCTQIAQLARQLPEGVLAQFTAQDVASIFGQAIRPTPADTQQRSAWRTGYELLLRLLQEAGVQPSQGAEDLVVACSLWACLQHMALSLALSDLTPRIAGVNTDPVQEARALRQRLFELREMLLADWSETTMVIAGSVLGRREARAAQAAEPAQESPAP